MASTPKGANSASQTLTTGTYVPTAAEGGSKFPPFDPNTFTPQLVWLAITFGALYLILSKVALPRIGEVIDERRNRIQRDLAEAERMQVETDAALKSYEKSLADARGKAQGIAKDMRDTLTADVDQERGRVDQQIAAKLSDTEKRITASKARALASVNDIAVDTARAIVANLIGRDVPEAEVRAALAGRTLAGKTGT